MNKKQKRALELVVLVILLPILAFVGGWLLGGIYEQELMKDLVIEQEIGADEWHPCDNWRFYNTVHLGDNKVDIAAIARDSAVAAQFIMINCLEARPAMIDDAIAWAGTAMAAGDSVHILLCKELGGMQSGTLMECEK